MTLRNTAALTLILASLACLYPGLFYNMMTVKVSASLPIIGHLNMYEATQSILQTIKSLFEANNNFVAFLILLFSVIVPIVKTIVLLVVLLFKQLASRQQLLAFVSVIGKWSMADVFVVSVFMAFLVSGSNENVQTQLHQGFYYFTAYCLLSILGTQLIQLAGSDKPAAEKPAIRIRHESH